MKKKLDTTSITNELQGASVFFRREPVVPSTPPQTTREVNSPTYPQKLSPLQPDRDTPKSHAETVFVAKEAAPAEKVLSPPLLQPPQPADNQQEPKSKLDDTVIPRHHDTVIPRYHSLTIPASEEVLETIRGAVRQLGKEAATYRFTAEEKQALAEIVFDYKNRKIRTSENEISRIAINLLIIDYKANGPASLLAKMLEKLNG